MTPGTTTRKTIKTIKTVLQTLLRPQPRGQRPRCLYCGKELEPQFIRAAMPASLMDGRRAAQRKEWEKQNPIVFTGEYGRFRDNRFCGAACGYHWAIAHAKARKN